MVFRKIFLPWLTAVMILKMFMFITKNVFILIKNSPEELNKLL